jgi:excisionase family DNA binding protein
MSLPNKAWFRVADVATYFDATPRTVYRWIQVGYLPSVKVGGVVRLPWAAMVQRQANGGLESFDD